MPMFLKWSFPLICFVADAAPLFPFTNFEFKAIVDESRTGPTLAQMKAAYAGEPWVDDYLEMGDHQGYQRWTVPETELYRIRADGAQGGGYPNNSFASYKTLFYGRVGYFNYDPSDNDYGPENWGDVQKTDEYNRWLELDKYHHHNLNNRCSTSTRQGPIDVCDSHAFTGTCNEFHQIRPVHGDYKLDNEHVTMQILPGRLRIKYDTRPNGPMIEKPETYTDQFKQTPQPPHADFAHYWNWHIQANHVDIKLPSEHTVCGKRFVGELTIWHLHPEPDKFQRPGQDSIVITILIDIHPQGRPNQHLQKAIEEWKKVSEKDTESCQSGRKLEEMYEGDYQLGQYADLSAHSDFLSSNIFADEMLGNEKSRDELNRQHRKAYETVEGKNQGWSPYNKEILNSLYFYAYHGSLTEPPCSEFVAWRVMHDPMYISRGQLEQLQDILFNHKNPNCERTSFDYKESVARPVKSHHVDHQFYQCTRDNYVSDKEKAYMREITGDPHWCC